MRTPLRRLLAVLVGLASVSAFASLGAEPVAQAATTCEANCLRVFAIKTYDYLPGTASQANVLVVDENGGGLRGVVVQGEWTLPDGTTAARYARIGVRGRAEFPLVTDQYGTATFRVLGMTLAGYTFDPDGGAATSVSVNIGTPPPAGCSTCVDVTRIDMSEKSRAVLATLTVAAETGEPIGGAVVTATWTKPNGATVTKTATTNASGIARLRIRKNGGGIHSLTVDDVHVTGLTYDAGNSVTTNSYTVS
jgi:hypothetical protein